MDIIKQCEWCGNDFHASRKDAKYCSNACSKKAGRQRIKQGLSVRDKTCPKCGNNFTIIDSGYNRKYCYNCVPKTAVSGAEVRQRIKQWSLDYKGRACQKCGYNRCLDALEFHHLNPLEKDFSISDRNVNSDWEAIKEELDKCILVCANCHREIHAEERRKHFE